MNDVVNIDLTGLNKDADIAIYNTVGLKITDKLFSMANGVELIDMSNAPSGIYILLLTTYEGTLSWKIEKE